MFMHNLLIKVSQLSLQTRAYQLDHMIRRTAGKAIVLGQSDVLAKMGRVYSHQMTMRRGSSASRSMISSSSSSSRRYSISTIYISGGSSSSSNSSSNSSSSSSSLSSIISNRRYSSTSNTTANKQSNINRLGLGFLEVVGTSNKVQFRSFSNFFGATSILDGLDLKKESVEKKNRQKLSRSLLDEAAASGRAIDEVVEGMSTQERAAAGYLNALEEEICTAIQEALLSTKIDLPGLRKTGKNIEIKYVVLNRDFSHVDAFWESDILSDFFQFSASKLMKDPNNDSTSYRSSSSNNINNGNNDSEKKAVGLTSEKLQFFEDRIKQSINQSLQNKEPTFRTAIIRRLEFRRVPRVFFRPYDTKNSKRLRQENRDAIVKRALDEHEMVHGNLRNPDDDDDEDKDNNKNIPNAKDDGASSKR